MTACRVVSATDPCNAHFMAKHKPGPGRPSRGKRHPFFTRIPEELASEVIEEADARDMSYSEYIALVVAEKHGRPTTFPPRQKPIAQQQDLGIGAA